MSRCLQYISLSSVREILTDPEHGVCLAYVQSPRVTFGELSCHRFAASEDKRGNSGRGHTLGKPGPFESCLARQSPESVDLRV